MKNFNLNIDGGYDASTKALMQQASDSGCDIINNYYSIDLDKLDDFITSLEKNEYNIFNTSSLNNCINATNKDKTIWVIISVARELLLLITDTIERSSNFVAQYSNNLKKRTSEDIVPIRYFFKNNEGVQYNEVLIEKSRVEPIYSELYPDINIDALYEEFMSSKESLLFLTGPPGVGKTTFIRHFLLKCGIIKTQDMFDASPTYSPIEPKIAYIKDAAVMLEGEFWSLLASLKTDLIIFDDLDFALTTRTPEHHQFVNNLLSFSDGVFGKKTKIIITTNIKIDDIDSALLRPGRCFDFLQLNSLARNAARDLWCTLLKMDVLDFDKYWPSQNMISQSDLMSCCYRIKRDFRERTYIKIGSRIYSVEEKVNKITNQPVGFKACQLQ